MEQGERAVLADPSEAVNTEQGGEARDSTAFLAGEVAGAEEDAKKQDLEEPSPEPEEEVAAESGGVDSEDREAFESPVSNAAPFEFRSAAADATPPRTSLRAWSRGRKLAGLTRFDAAGDAEPAGSHAAVLGASSSSSAPLKGTHEDVPSRADRMLKRACSAPGATVSIAIAHASPPDSYRRVPSRSRKQYSPKRFFAAAGASPPSAAIPGSALPSSSASGLRTGSSSVIDASASSSSSRPPSRGRKQRRPEHFIPEEAEATASAKARRSDVVLDRFLSSIVHGTTASDTEWVSNVTAKDAAVRGQHRPNDVEGFRIRDASRHHARARGLRAALSRLGGSCVDDPFSSAAASGSPPGERAGGRRGFYGVLTVLGASLALSVVSCVLFYIVGGRSEAGPSAEQPDE